MNAVEQAKALKPILEAIIEQNPRVRNCGRFACFDFPSKSLGQVLEAWSIAPLEFHAPPEGEKWHNPDNLTADEVEVDKGYRLLLESEVAENGNSRHCNWLIEMFHYGEDPWQSGCYGDCRNGSYRTKNPLPKPAVEMTVADVEKLVGKRVKIVK